MAITIPELSNREAGFHQTDVDSVGPLLETVITIPLASTAATAVIATSQFMPVLDKWKVIAVELCDESAVVADASNYAVVTLKGYSTTGAIDNATLAVLNTSTAAINALKPTAFTLGSNTVLADGGAISLTVTKAGAGVTVGNGIIAIKVRRA